MGRNAVKKRAEESKARKKGIGVQPSDLPLEPDPDRLAAATEKLDHMLTSNSDALEIKSTSEVASDAAVVTSTRITRTTRSRAASALVVKGGNPKTVKDVPPQEPMESHKEMPDNPTSARPLRNAAQAVSALYERLANEENGTDEDEMSLADEYEESEVNDVDRPISIEVPPQKAVKGKKAVVKATQKAAVVNIELNESSDDESENFNFTMEILNTKKGIREFKEVSSAALFYLLKKDIAEILDVFEGNLNIQYRFSTEAKSELPCDLLTQQHFHALLTRLKPLVVPPILANGRHSTKAMKPVSVQVFNKSEGDPAMKGDGKKPTVSAQQSSKFSKEKVTVSPEADDLFTKRKTACQEIVQNFACDIHSLPDKPSACWKHPALNICYPITENNLNLWATLYVKNPDKYSVDKLPQEVHVLSNAPRTRAPGLQQGAGHGQQMIGQFPVAPGPMHAPFYYPPPAVQPMWYGGQGPPAPYGFQPLHNPPVNVAPAFNQGPAVVYPAIGNWLKYCDCHPDRGGEDFSVHIEVFGQQGYRRMDQLTGHRITVEKLSDWLHIGKGTADLLIRYAEEDVELIKNGMFTMSLTDSDKPATVWA